LNNSLPKIALFAWIREKNTLCNGKTTALNTFKTNFGNYKTNFDGWFTKIEAFKTNVGDSLTKATTIVETE